jgi:hypothetical protein
MSDYSILLRVCQEKYYEVVKKFFAHPIYPIVLPKNLLLNINFPNALQQNLITRRIAELF